MSYGLYDADLPYYAIPFYNLELMKISSYYKRKREIVGLSPDFSPNRYSNFIVRQDFYNPSIPFYRGKNVELGGRAFDGEKYKPLPLEIEKMKPDISLYNNAYVSNTKTKKYKNALSTMRRAEHIRLSLDEHTIWKDYDKQIRHDLGAFGIIFHDYNLNTIDGAAKFIKQMLPEWIAASNGRRIGTKFPIQVDTQTDLYEWLCLKPMGLYYSLQHNGLLDESYIPDLLEIKQEFKTTNQTSINISNSFTEEELINGGLQRILRNIINLRSHRLIFPLIYNENLLIDKNWNLVMKLIYYYNQHLVSSNDKQYFKYVEPYETVFSFCFNFVKSSRNRDSFFNKENMIQIFQFVRENNYDLFKDFYEYRGGEVKNDR